MITDNKQALNFDSIGSQKGQLVFLSFIMATDNISKRTMYNPAKFQVKFRNEARRGGHQGHCNFMVSV